MLRSLAALSIILAAVAAPVAAQGQSLCQAPTVSFSPTSATVSPGGVARFNATVTNPNQFQTRGTLSFEAPPGFAAEPAQASLGIPGGASTVVTVRLEALANAPVGDDDRTLIATAILTCGVQPPLETDSDVGEATATLRVVAAPGSPIEDALDVARQPPVIALAGLALVVLVGGLALRGRREGFAVRCAEARKPVRPGRGTSFPLEVENRSQATDTASFDVAEVPAGWTAFTALPEVQLGPREKRTVWVMVRAPADAAVGAHAEITVRTGSRAHPTRTTQVPLVAEVSEEAVEAPAPEA